MAPSLLMKRLPYVVLLVLTNGMAAAIIALAAHQLSMVQKQENETSDYQIRLGVLIFGGAWTLIFGIAHCWCTTVWAFLWSALTWALWVALAGTFHEKNMRQRHDYYCTRYDVERNMGACDLLALEYITWFEVAFSFLLLLAFTFAWVWRASPRFDSSNPGVRTTGKTNIYAVIEGRNKLRSASQDELKA